MALKLSLKLSEKADDELDNYAQDKVTRVTGNAAFPSAQIAIGKVATILPNYTAAIGNQNGTKADTATKNKLKAELIKQLTITAKQCAIDADENDEVFLASGFPLADPGGPVGEQGKPKKFDVTLSVNAGEATASMEPFRKAKGFAFAWTKDPIAAGSTWTVIPWPKRTYTFKDLPSGTKVWIKAGAVSPNGTINYSDPVSRTIQ